MLLRLVISSLMILVMTNSQAEINLSEKIRPAKPSLVNEDIPRLALPPTPHNITLPAFGQGIIGWGSGPNDAQHRLNTISQYDVEQLKTKDVTLDMIQTWQKFYENETRRNPNNPTAPLRAQLMQKIAQLW